MRPVTPAAPLPEGRRAARSVLVVEPDELFRYAIQEALETGGHVVWPARDWRDGLALATARRPDAVVLDRALELADARAFRQAQQADPALAAIPVLVICGDALDLAPLPGCSALPMPFGLDELLLAVARVLG